MPIIYSVVARGTTVLAEHAATSGNFVSVSRRILEKIGADDGRMSYQYDRYMFHYVVDRGLTVMCMTDSDIGRRTPFAFLEDVCSRFGVRYGAQWHDALAFEYNDEFGHVLRSRMEFHGQNTDRLDRVKGEIDEVRNVMVGNIEKVLNRGEKIDLLVGKTESLNQQAFQFKKQSNRLKQVMWWRKCKTNTMIFLVVSVLLFVLAGSVCGFKFDKC